MQRVSVIGLGKMGLPIAAYIAINGADVSGIDIDPAIVASIDAGECPIHGEAGLEKAVADAVENGTLRASTTYESVTDADVVVVLVPLLAIDGVPDFRVLDSAVESLADNLDGETLVVFETTLPVGTTKDRFAKRLRESAPATLVAFSPERVFSGRVFQDLETYPKIVGGVDDASTTAAVQFYESVLSAEVWPVASSEDAEMVKLAETTYRDLNIAYANELARICDRLGLDVTDVIKGANSQPFSHIHAPGIGVGGHCIPHYPHLLLNAGVPSELISLGRSVNDSMPQLAADKLSSMLGTLQGKNIVALGVAYRPGVREHVSSPVFGLDTAVRAAGGDLQVTDPLYEPDAVRALGLDPWDGESTPDAFVLVTPHTEFTTEIVRGASGAAFLDGRNAWDATEIESMGLTYTGIGR